MLARHELLRPLGDGAGLLCPNCGRPMHLMQGISQPTNGVSVLRTYSCGECGVRAEAADDGRDGSAPR